MLVENFNCVMRVKVKSYLSNSSKKLEYDPAFIVRTRIVCRIECMSRSFGVLRVSGVMTTQSAFLLKLGTHVEGKDDIIMVSFVQNVHLGWMHFCHFPLFIDTQMSLITQDGLFSFLDWGWHLQLWAWQIKMRSLDYVHKICSQGVIAGLCSHHRFSFLTNFVWFIIGNHKLNL